MNHVKILSYNIHKGFGLGAKNFTLHQMREVLNELHPHVVFLQEVQGSHQRHQENIKEWPTSSQFEFLADSLWPHFSYGKNAVYTSGHHGNAILSKYPILSWENFDVSPNRFEKRGLLHAVLKLPKGYPELHVVCVHLGLFETDRKRQITILTKRIDQLVPKNKPVIVAGDFNDWRGTADFRSAKGLNLREAFFTAYGEYAKTFPAFFPVLRLDRIYYRGFALERARSLTEPPFDSLSDHIPLEAVFSLKKSVKKF